MRINNNIMAMNAQRQFAVNQSNAAQRMERLSSGMRINRAGDDAAGLAISEKMRGQIRGLKQAQRNAQDAISLIQTAEGALNETHAILQRMRELAVQSATDTNTDDDRAEIQAEIDQLATEITRIADTTEFNTMNLLGGGFSAIFHIGANDGQNLDLEIADMTAAALGVAGVGGGADGEDASYVHTSEEITGFDFSSNNATVTIGGITVTLNADYKNIDGLAAALDFNAEGVTVTVKGNTLVFTGTEAFTIKVAGDGATALAGVAGTAEAAEAGGAGGSGAGIDVSSQDAANSAIDTIDSAITIVSTERSKLGALQNRLEHTIANLGTSAENLQAAESRIRDLDMAEEIMAFTKNNILQQAATAMLTQANMAPQSVQQLLGQFEE